MRRVEFKVCRECKRIYRWESGGIIATSWDYMDFGLCKNAEQTDHEGYYKKPWREEKLKRYTRGSL